MTNEHIKECKTQQEANALIATGEYRLMEFDKYRGYILVARAKPLVPA